MASREIIGQIMAHYQIIDGGAEVSEVEGPLTEKETGRTYYRVVVSYGGPSMTGKYFPDAFMNETEGEFCVVVKGKKLALRVNLLPGHSAKDHLFKEYLRAIQSQCHGQEYPSKKAAEEAAYEAVREVLSGGPAFKVMVG